MQSITSTELLIDRIEEDVLEIGEYLSLLVRRRWVILGMTFVFAVAGILFVGTAQQHYSVGASATMPLVHPSGIMAPLEESEVLQHELAIGRSPEVAGMAMSLAGSSEASMTVGFNNADGIVFTAISTDQNAAVIVANSYAEAYVASTNAELVREITLLDGFLVQLANYGIQVSLENGVFAMQTLVIPPEDQSTDANTSEGMSSLDIDVIGARVNLIAEATEERSLANRFGQSAILGASLGLILGIAYASIREQLTAPYTTPEDFTRTTGMATVFEIPTPPTVHWSRETVTAWAETDNVRSILSFVCTSVLKLHEDRTRVAVLAGIEPSADAAAATIAMAHTLVDLGQRVLLVDGDSSAKHLSVALDSIDTPGLTDIVKGSSNVEPTEHAGFSVLAAGSRQLTPAQLWTNNRLRDRLAALTERYDTVLITVPSLISNPDSLLTTAVADSLVLVGRLGDLKSHDLAQIWPLLEQASISPQLMLALVDRSGRGQ